MPVPLNANRRLSRPRVGAERGAALIELAVTLPLLMLLVVGTIDFGRVFKTANVVTNAARAGALYGARTLTNSVDNAGMIARANAVLTANNLATGATPTVSRVCRCYDNNANAVGGAVACTASCTGSHMVIDVTVTASRTFTMLGSFPGIPSSVTLTRSHTMRAQ